MVKNYNMYSKSTALVVLLFGLLLISVSPSLATSVDRMSLTNLDSYPGKTTTAEIRLEGTDLEERSGFWYSYYKAADGDSNKMDITSWITIDPKEYTIKKGETKVFNIEIKIPKDAEPGLWGASSEDAAKEGHSGERKTYIVFKDSLAGGNIYSGLLIPISVNVLPSSDPLAPVINFIEKNIITIVLSIIIVVLLIKPLLKKKKRVYYWG